MIPFRKDNWYYVVGDNNPLTEVFASKRHEYVSQTTDLQYLAFVSGGDTAMVFSTEADLFRFLAMPSTAYAEVKVIALTNVASLATLVPGFGVNGYVLQAGDKFGLGAQTDKKQNGLYIAQYDGSPPVRDFSIYGSWNNFFGGSPVIATEGGTRGLGLFSCSGVPGDIGPIGTFDITFGWIIGNQPKDGVSFGGGTFANATIGLAGGGSIFDSASSQGTSSQVLHGGTAPVWAAPSVGTSGTVDVLDSNFQLRDNSDQTKRAQFQLSAISAGQTRVLTVPDASGTLALTDVAQTFTGIQTFSTKVLTPRVDGSASLTVEALAGNAELRASGTVTLRPLAGSVNFANASGIFFQVSPVGPTGPYNYIQWVGNTSGNNPYVAAQGGDANVGMTYLLKGSAAVLLFGIGGVGNILIADNTKVTIPQSTAATSTSSGALQVAGGAGIVGEVHAGGLIAHGATGGVGYGTGAGGSVTQLTSKSTSVTLDTLCGKVTMHNAALAANTSVTFSFNNSKVTRYDTIAVSLDHSTFGSSLNYQIEAMVYGGSDGIVAITLRNITAGSLSEAVAFNFAVIKGVVS